MNRIHITGAAGSGTSTLASALTNRIPHVHLDTDDYLWETKYTQFRSIDERVQLLKEEFNQYPQWILSGSLTGWGDPIVPYFDIVIYLWVSKEIRLERLRKREFERYGKEIYSGGKNYDSFHTFMDWASQYDEAGLNIRSRKSHEKWMSELTCPILRIEGDFTIEERVNKVLECLDTK
ncbi:AAA family ATPase [Chengkuizengella axinellae]|uniref:AAA family ATPase n=1 Tax=Chengkuizengella axinellae TaxID=3064388 RepID=A0ABT9J2L5_9BACL|nr:AAA family ATPase [Chengkuizengella sp. 2205SS18-9]MDP5275856.1 AAA family ATPase [Chengkuizengella sp. 2205SS18-9]